MRIVIVGAGAVGSYLAMRLSSEGQDVVVIESDERRAAEVQEELDVLVVVGNGASPNTLKQSDIGLADMLIAVSDSDGVNALACHTARNLGVERTVARIADSDLRAGVADLGVDVIIDPDEMAAQEVVGLVGQSGVSDIIEFADGQLTLLGGIARRGSPLVGHTIADLRAFNQDLGDWAVAAVVRGGDAIPVRGPTTVRENDHVLVMVGSDNLAGARRLLGLDDVSVERVIVLGSTRIAERTVDLLAARRIEVVLIDPDEERCRYLAEHHPRALVINGDTTDPSVLANLGLDDTDAIAALSGWDDANLAGCFVGKALGASTAVARFQRLSYVGLLIGTGIDASVSPRLSAANAILRFVRRGRIHSVATFKDTRAEALDIEVEPGSSAAGYLLQEIDLPGNAVVGGVARNGRAFVPRGTTKIEPNDRLIVFVPPEAIHDVEALCTT